MNLMLPTAFSRAVLGGSLQVPAIRLSGSNALLEGSAQNTAVGNLSVVNPKAGTYTFTLTGTAGSRFKVAGTNGVNLQAGAAAADYETATSYDITVHADNGAGSVIDRTITIAIINSLEVTLNALTLTAVQITSGDPEGTVIGALQSLSSGSTLSLTDTAGGRFKLSGTNIVAGATATDFATATSHNITVRETHADGSNSPRDSVIAITVLDLVVAPDAPGLTMDPTWDTTQATPLYNIDGAFIDQDDLQFEVMLAGGNWLTDAVVTHHTVTTSEINGTQVANFGNGPVPNGARVARCRFKHVGGSYSNYSVELPFTVAAVASDDDDYAAWMAAA